LSPSSSGEGSRRKRAPTGDRTWRLRRAKRVVQRRALHGARFLGRSAAPKGVRRSLRDRSRSLCETALSAPL